MNMFRDVHVYDGQLQNIFTQTLTREVNEDDIVEHVNDILDKLKSQEAKNCVNLILSQTGNIDNANNVNAFDVLIEVCLLLHEMKESEDVLNLLDEQLADCYMLGQCPQGRTTRLIQIYQILAKKKESK